MSDVVEPRGDGPDQWIDPGVTVKIGPGELAQRPKSPIRSIRLQGTGHHALTNVIDAETGENLAKAYGITSVRLEISSEHDNGRPRLILELRCPIVVDLTGEPVPDLTD